MENIENLQSYVLVIKEDGTIDCSGELPQILEDNPGIPPHIFWTNTRYNLRFNLRDFTQIILTGLRKYREIVIIVTDIYALSIFPKVLNDAQKLSLEDFYKRLNRDMLVVSIDPNFDNPNYPINEKSYDKLEKVNVASIEEMLDLINSLSTEIKR